MKVAVTSLLLVSLFICSCKHSKQEMILGEWRGVNFENPEMDSFFNKSQQYIDTIGKNGNPATNLELYGATNMDSIRNILQQEHDSTKMLQLNAVKNTVFTFMKDSIVVISFDGRMDTSKWRFENEHSLVMEELTGNSKGSKTTMDIVSLTDKELTLKFIQENTYSTVTFNKGKN